MKFKLHQELTSRALDMYEKETGLLLSSQLKKEIIHGVKAEDNVWEIPRLWNWHFYFQNEHIEIYTKILKMRRTSEHIFEKRVQDLYDHEDDPKKYGECLGRVLHHIQDMHTPSHVVPIYHIANDDFEAFMVDTLNDGKLNPIMPSESWMEFSTLMEQYHLAAKNTYRFIQDSVVKVSSDNRDERLHLSLFWRDYVKHEDPKRSGFGTFSKAQKVFKRTKKYEYNTNFIHENRAYHIKTDEMYNICNLISGRAIKETIRTLYCINL